MKKDRVYALYKGEEFLTLGTIDEIASIMKVKRETIYFYTMPAYKRRIKKGGKNRRYLIKI